MVDADDDTAARIAAVEAATGHRFADAVLIERACTHASFCAAQSSARDRLAAANERLEFLGDALLGAALCLLLFQRFPDASEGALSKRKSQLASRATLARVIDAVGLLPHCRVGSQMARAWPDSVKANLMEAILAAVFIDAGWPALLGAVERVFTGRLDADSDTADDAKTALQEWSLAHFGVLPQYTSNREGGSDHEPMFVAKVTAGELTATGSGGSRRRAEAAAASALWELAHRPAPEPEPDPEVTDDCADP